MTATLIVTMAGLSRRFADAGYVIPKYRVRVHDRTLLSWSLLSLRGFVDAAPQAIFIARAADGARSFIEEEARAVGLRRVSIVELDAPTNGQATTAMKALPVISAAAAPVVIYNIDTFVHPNALPPSAVRGDGWIPCFDAEGDGWSFAAADATGKVTEVREKSRISRHATVGLYYFSSFDLYADLYARHFPDESRFEKGEAYVAPMYNTLISLGRNVFIHDVPADAVIPLGVPADVERFANRRSPPL